MPKQRSVIVKVLTFVMEKILGQIKCINFRENKILEFAIICFCALTLFKNFRLYLINYCQSDGSTSVKNF